MKIFRFYFSPWQWSFLIHFVLVAIILFFSISKREKIPLSFVPLEVYRENEVQQIEKINKRSEVVLKSVNSDQNIGKATRKIFGTSRNSYTDIKNENGVEAKLGNTLGKIVDNEKLQDSDSDQLPTPTESYLVSEMPEVLKEVRPEYPTEAREKGIEGVVVMDILIDKEGVVRKANVVEGEALFQRVALDAILKFIFKPAQVKGQSVAVYIRYTLKFKLDY